MFNRSRISRRTAPCDVPDGAHPESQRVQRGNARQIDEEVKQILSEAHGRARNILAAHRTALDELAGLLLEKEVIDSASAASDPKSTEHRQPQRKKTRRGPLRKRKPSEQRRTGIASGWEMIGAVASCRFDLPTKANYEERNQTPRRKVRRARQRRWLFCRKRT
ncbi:MAG: hypothetical protein ACXWXZ_02100 [Candidatus Binatia bacterium]